MENRINQLFKTKKDVLSIYFSAGFPKLNDTVSIIQSLEKSGVDLIEIGIPFSDPLADGETIQQSSKVALDNGMTLNLLFEQLENIRESVKIPLILMGYLNPVWQYGMDKFLAKCKAIGIDGLILPDMPLDYYQANYKAQFDEKGISNVFLITPQTAEARIREIDAASNGFIYMVSSASTTGSQVNAANQEAYFTRVNKMGLKNPTVIGFGIHDNASFTNACKYAKGAIIGSEFIRRIKNAKDLDTDIAKYIKEVRG